VTGTEPRQHRYIPIALWLIAIAISLWVLFTRAHMSTDMAQFMPDAKTPAEKLLLEELNQGAASRLLLLAIEAKDPHSPVTQQTIQTLAQLSREFAKQLKQSERFNRVDNGMPAKQDKQDQRLLFQYRYLLSHQINQERFQTPSLRALLERRLLELSSPMGMMNKRTFTKDPTNELGTIVDSLQPQQNTNTQYGVWFSGDNRKALLMLQTQAPGFDLDAQERNITAIGKIFQSLDQGTPAQNYTLTLSGSSVFATQSRKKIEKEITLLSAAAGIAVILILLLAYRSVSLTLISALPLVSGILFGTAGVILAFGQIHGVTLAFGVTILGVAIDYPIHAFSHLKPPRSVTYNIGRIWPTLRLGVVTTATGYLAMAFTHFSGLAQLSWFAIIGLLAAAAITRWVVPAVLPAYYVPKTAQQTNGVLAPDGIFARMLQPGFKTTLGMIILAITACGYITLTDKTIWQNDLSALSPLPKDKLQLDKQLRAELGAPDVHHMVLISDTSAETVLQKSEQLDQKLRELKTAGIVASVDMASHYLPSVKTQTQRQALLPDELMLRQQLTAAVQGMPFRDGQFEPFVQSVVDSKTLPALTLEHLQNSALGLKLSSLLFQRSDHWTAVVILYDARQPQKLTEWFQQQDLDGVYYLNLKQTSNILVSSFRQETLSRMQWAILAIIVVLWLGLRSWDYLVAATLPVGAAIVCVMALLIALDMPLSLFNLVAVLLVFGIGIDYGLFFNRNEVDIQEKLRTFHALSVCCISTVTVFGLLSLSHIPVLKDMGHTVSVGVLLSFVFALSLSQTRRLFNK